MDRGGWQATSSQDHKESVTTEVTKQAGTECVEETLGNAGKEGLETLTIWRM